MAKFQKGDRVSFISEGDGLRRYGVVDRVDGDAVFIKCVDRVFQLSLEHDEIEYN